MNWAGKGEASKNSPAAKLNVTELFNTNTIRMCISYKCLI